MRSRLVAAGFAVLMHLSATSTAQEDPGVLRRQASEDLKVIDAKSLTPEGRKEYELAVAMIRAAKQATGGADASLLAERAAVQVAQLLRQVLGIDVEAGLAERYRATGTTDALLNAAAERSSADLNRLADLAVANRGRLGRRTSAFARFTPQLLAADVLLHTSVSFSATGDMVHLRYAKRVLASLDDTQLPIGFRRGWYLAALGHVEGQLELLDGAALADEAAARFPADAEVLIAAGVFEEALARPSVQLPTVDKRLLWGKASDDMLGLPGKGSNERKIAALWERKRSALGRAEQMYRQAVAFDPANVEGHLRLGRVLCLSGRPEDALVEFRHARTAGNESVAYLAAMFAGDAYERQDRWNQAIEAYMQAVSICSSCRTASVALSYAERRAGNIPKAAETLNAALGGRGNARDDDPWWYYPLGSFLSRERLIEGLRRSLTASLADSPFH
jgi:tetratricopeptide (TPR) repeat protein